MAEDSLYKFSPAETTAVADSYNALGGLSGTGMDYNTWLKSQNINNVNGNLSTGTLNNSLFGADGFGWNKGTLQGLGSIGNLASGLGGLFLGTKQLGLAEDQFAFNKDMANKEYTMAKDAYDRQVARAADVGSQMRAGKVG